MNDCLLYVQDTTIPGNALVVDAKKQFRPLSKFGNAFLNRFQCSMVKNDVLKSLTIVDTPGILSGEKQRLASDSVKRLRTQIRRFRVVEHRIYSTVPYLQCNVFQ